MKFFMLGLVLAGSILCCQAQEDVAFESTLDVSTFSFYRGLLNVDAGLGWKGYYLSRNDKTGFRITSTNGICLKEVLHLGLGLSYARYDNISGVLVFGDLRIDILKTSLAPYIFLHPGYSHFWNQYEGGTGTPLFEFGPGLRYCFAKAGTLQLSAGLLMMQQNAYQSWSLSYTF